MIPVRKIQNGDIVWAVKNNSLYPITVHEFEVKGSDVFLVKDQTGIKEPGWVPAEALFYDEMSALLWLKSGVELQTLQIQEIFGNLQETRKKIRRRIKGIRIEESIKTKQTFGKPVEKVAVEETKAEGQ